MNEEEVGGGCCGPIGNRLEQISRSVEMLIQGHQVVAETYRAIASDPALKLEQEDAEALLRVADFHSEVAASCKANIPLYEEK